MDRCRKCGRKIDGIIKGTKTLWCEYCRKYVDDELNGKTSQPFSFYFRYYQKTKGDK